MRPIFSVVEVCQFTSVSCNNKLGICKIKSIIDAFGFRYQIFTCRKKLLHLFYHLLHQGCTKKSPPQTFLKLCIGFFFHLSVTLLKKRPKGNDFKKSNTGKTKPRFGKCFTCFGCKTKTGGGPYFGYFSR